MCWANFSFPILGHPKLWIYVAKFGDFLFVSIAEIVDKAAPKLWPVTVNFAYGYLANNFWTTS